MSLYTEKAMRLTADKDSAHQYESLLISEIESVEANAYIRNFDALYALSLNFVFLDSQQIPLEILRGNGFEIAIPRKNQLIIQLTDAKYRQVFFKLCDDICELIADATSDNEAISKCISRLIAWRKFFHQNRMDGLSRERIIGLFGELTVLNNLLTLTLPMKESIRGWKGYTGANHDFQYEKVAIEVKTTTARTPEHVHISNVQQLDDEGLPALLLCLVHLKETKTSGETLPQLVEKIRLQLDHLERNRFDDALIEVGYLDEKNTLTRDLAFLITRYFLYRVKAGFPRIINIPAGVKQLEYKISLDAAAPYLIDQNLLASILGET